MDQFQEWMNRFEEWADMAEAFYSHREKELQEAKRKADALDKIQKFMQRATASDMEEWWDTAWYEPDKFLEATEALEEEE